MRAAQRRLPKREANAPPNTRREIELSRTSHRAHRERVAAAEAAAEVAPPRERRHDCDGSSFCTKPIRAARSGTRSPGSEHGVLFMLRIVSSRDICYRRATADGVVLAIAVARVKRAGAVASTAAASATVAAAHGGSSSAEDGM